MRSRQWCWAKNCAPTFRHLDPRKLEFLYQDRKLWAPSKLSDCGTRHENPGEDKLGDVGGFSRRLGAGGHRRLCYRQTQRDGGQSSERTNHDGGGDRDPNLHVGERQSSPATTNEGRISSLCHSILCRTKQ